MSDARLALVGRLTQATLELLRPVAPKPGEEKSPAIAEAAPAAILQEPKSFYLTTLPPAEAGAIPESPTPRLTAPPSGPTSLDSTLVAGMFFQVLLEAEQLPGNPLERVSYLKRAVKNFLVQRLAGQITLAQFFRLVQVIELEVATYFHRLPEEWRRPLTAPQSETRLLQPPAADNAVRIDKLQQALQQLPLPRQSNRKLSVAGLAAFLIQTGGNWFRLLDFERHFRLNKKTAWAYLDLLLRSGVLQHNRAKANRVRYALAADFLQHPGAAAAG